MSSIPFVPLAAHTSRPSLHGDEERATSSLAELYVADASPPAPPRDPLELMLLHGDCAFLLDLWAL